MDLRRDRLDAARRRLTNPGAGAGAGTSDAGAGVDAEPRTTAITTRVLVAVLLAGWVLSESWGPSRLGDPERWWAVAGVLATAGVLAWALPELRRLLPRPGDVPLVLGSVLLAIYLCVPETDQIPRVALVVTVVVIGEAVSRRPLPMVLLAIVAADVMWAGVFGATGRQSALVGMLVAWWPVVLLPLAAAWRPTVVDRGTWFRGLIVTIGAIAAIGVARTGALEPTVTPAIVAAAIAIPTSAVATRAVVSLADRRR